MRVAAKGTETENLFETLANKSPVGLYIVQDGKFCYTNPTFQSATGYREDELLGRDSLEIVVPEDRERVRENAMKMLKGKLTSPYQFRVTHKNGSIQWVIESVASVQYRGRQATLGNFVDITERKQMEEALQAAKNKLQSLIDAMEDNLTIQDRDYNLIYLSARVKKLWGDCIGEKCYRAFEGQDKVCDECPVEKAFKDGESYTAERRTVIPSGEVIFWENTANPIRDAEGRIVSCLEVSKDITERKKTEKALRDSEEKSRKIFESATDGMSVIDLEGVIVELNQRTVEMHGFSSKDELRGKSAFKLVVPRDHERIAANVKKATKQGALRGAEYTLLRADGSEFYGELSTSVLKDDSGNVVGYIIIARDITERKKMEEAINLQRAYFQQLFDNSPDAILMMDTNDRAIQANRGFEVLFGYSNEEVKGRSLPELIVPEVDVQEASTSLQRILGGEVVRKESVRRRKDGSLVDVSVLAYPIRSNDKLVGAYGVYSDITERKQAEEALQAERNKLQSLIDAMEDTITIQDTEYNIIYQNEPSRIASGGDHLGEKCYRAYEGRETVCDGCPVEEAFKDGKSHTTERRTTIAGKVAFWENTANPIRDAEGRVVTCLELARDITEHKRAAEALQIERNKLQSVIDAMADALTIQDTEYNIIFQNGPSRKTTGGDRTGEKCYWVYEGSDKICDGCPVEKAFKNGKPHTSERQRVLPSGELSFWENTANPIKDAGGKVVSCLEIGRNITERKKQEQALADELTRRRLLVDQSLDGIVVLDVDAKVYEANQRFAEMLGYTLKEVRELHTWDWDKNFPPEKILEMGRNVDEKGFHLETQHTRKDGSVIDVDISINAAMFGEQKLIFCVGRDVTERKRAQEALKDSEESYRELADSFTDVFFAMDEHLRYTYWNKASEILTGIRAEDAIGKSLLQIFPDTPEIRKTKKVYRDVLRTQQSRTFVNEFDINGRHYIFEISAYPSRGGISVFVRDITERKQAEEAIKQAAEEWRKDL